MPAQPPAKPTCIVIARPPRKRPKAVPATVASPRPVRIVYAPTRKSRDAWRRFKELTDIAATVTDQRLEISIHGPVTGLAPDMQSESGGRHGARRGKFVSHPARSVP
jgi:hypothetical protein